MAIETASRSSYRPLILLVLTALGRSLIGVGSGILVDGATFKKSLTKTQPAVGPPPSTSIRALASYLAACTSLNPAGARSLPASATSYNAQISAAAMQSMRLNKIKAGVLMGVGGGLFACGATLFAMDGFQVNKRRASVFLTASILGTSLITAAGVLAEFAVDHGLDTMRGLVLLPRAIGSFLVFYSIPHTFSTCEILHGNLRIAYREQTRQILQALGATMLLIWGTLNQAALNAPLWLKETLQVLAIIGLVLGNALSMTQMARNNAERARMKAAARANEVALQALSPA